MATYAVGDIQGCFQELQLLLAKVHFDWDQDVLWCTGDLVNRGPQSLEVLRFLHERWKATRRVVTVLGNHDLHLFALSEGLFPKEKAHTLEAILAADDAADLLLWLRNRPLLHHDSAQKFTLVHAGILPEWSMVEASALAREVEAALQGPDYGAFLAHMYGDQPDQWSASLAGWARLRFISNSFTRMRFCDEAGRLNLVEKGPMDSVPQDAGLVPWFQVAGRACAQETLVFGHWAALAGKTGYDRAWAVDGGCAWGGRLIGVRLEDGQRFYIPAQDAAP